jgi:cysteinyl-tRNA synthetase
VDLDEYEKDSTYDFTLFKRVNLTELKRGIGWDTDWGKARPGWHIECAAMSMKYLGELFDIHTSGINLAFPHHENEVAIARALTGNRLARYWLHSELVIEDDGSGKGPGAVTLRQLFEKGFSGRQIRFYLLRSHYRKQITFSEKGLTEAARGLARLDAFIEDLLSCSFLHRQRVLSDDVSKQMAQLKEDFMAACLDDLNIPRAMGLVFGAIRRLNPQIAKGEIGRADARLILETLRDLDDILAVMNIPGGDGGLDRYMELDADTERLLEERAAARSAKDWRRADLIRKRLEGLGVKVIDTPGGQRIRLLADLPEPDAGSSKTEPD